MPGVVAVVDRAASRQLLVRGRGGRGTGGGAIVSNRCSGATGRMWLPEPASEPADQTPFRSPGRPLAAETVWPSLRLQTLSPLLAPLSCCARRVFFFFLFCFCFCFSFYFCFCFVFFLFAYDKLLAILFACLERRARTVALRADRRPPLKQRASSLWKEPLPWLQMLVSYLLRKHLVRSSVWMSPVQRPPMLLVACCPLPRLVYCALVMRCLHHF